MSEPRRYRLRRSLELFLASDGDAYLLRGGSGQEHIVRGPSARDRELLRALARGPVPVSAGSDDARRIDPLVTAGAVVEVPDDSALTPEDRERFDRQLPYLEDLGDPVDAQLRLRRSTVGIIGCGGLGTWALGALASTGVGRFVLVDDDTVQLSNLNRQILYGRADVGGDKATLAAAWLTRFDPSVDVRTVGRFVEGPSDFEELAHCDAWVLTADHPPYELSRWINAAALRHRVPFVVAGQQPPLVKVGPFFMPGERACFGCQERALRAAFPLYDELAAARSAHPPPAATLGPASALIGSLIALEVLHALLGRTPATAERLLVLDIASLETTWHDVRRDAACEVCGG